MSLNLAGIILNDLTKCESFDVVQSEPPRIYSVNAESAGITQDDNGVLQVNVVMEIGIAQGSIEGLNITGCQGRIRAIQITQPKEDVARNDLTRAYYALAKEEGNISQISCGGYLF